MPPYMAQFLKAIMCMSVLHAYVFTLCACLVLMEVRTEIPEPEVTGRWLVDTMWVPLEGKVSQ